MIDQKKTKTHKKSSNLVAFGWFVLSWVVTLLLGVILCLFVLWFVSFMTWPVSGGNTEPSVSYGSYAARTAILYGLLSVSLIAVTAVLIRRRFKHIFFYFMRIALGMGLVVNSLVLIGGIVGAINFTVGQYQWSTGLSHGGCSSLYDQRNRTVGATVPIETDTGSGTAFAIDAKGHYVTAYHVIEGAKRVRMNLIDDNSKLKVVKTQPDYDLALLKGPETQDYLDLTATYDQADDVYALGYPGNAYTAGQASLSRGIIARVLTSDDLRLNDDKSPRGLEMLQTDAALNPGNSGGPLVNRCGVIGVVSSVSDVEQLHDYGLESEQNISFAISSKTVARAFSLEISEDQ